MRIRSKLLLGFGFYIFFALILGFFAYGELRAITSRLAILEAADDLTNTMLEVRRYEKNFLLYKDKGSSRILKRHLGNLREGIDRIEAGSLRESSSQDFAAARTAVNEYEEIFDVLSGPLGEEGASLELMREKARDIQSFVESLSRRERAAIASLLLRSERSNRILLLAILATLVLGVVVNMRLSLSIAVPLKNLEDQTRKIASGDFSERISVRGEDEISSLGRSFNLMQDRLHETLTTLALANETLRANRAQLIQAEKFATLGRFSVGVAHEINNPLAIISEKAGLMKDYLAVTKDFPERDQFLGLLDAIAESVTRCSVFTHRILDYARTGAVDSELVDVNSLVGEVLKAAEPEFRAKDILVRLELREDLPSVRSGRARIRQVLGDIVKNAVEAVADGGLIRISSAMRNAQALQVSVEDNGAGIPAEMLEHVFEPFSPGREAGTSAGLGLSIAYGAMRSLGGDIEVSSEPGRGTTFTVIIPVPGLPPTSAPVEPHPREGQAGAP